MKRIDSRRAAQRERQRNDILDEALVAFAARGYEHASMTEIASAAGCSVGHVYNVVGNKGELFEAAILRDGEEFERRIDAVIEHHQDASPRECIDDLIDVALEFFDGHRQFFQIYLNEAGGVRSKVDRVFSAPLVGFDRRIARKVERQLRLAVRKGFAAQLPPADMQIALSELINGFLAAWAQTGYRGRIARKARIIKHLLWKGIQA